MENDWDDAGFVSASKHRKGVLTRLCEAPAKPSTIAQDIQVHQNNVSNVLQDLRERDLVQLLVDENRKKGRIYGITERGQRVVEQLNSKN